VFHHSLEVWLVLELHAPQLNPPDSFYVDLNLSKLKSFKYFNSDSCWHSDEQYLKY